MHKYKIYLHIMHKWRIIMQKKGEKEMRLRKGGQIMNDIGRMKNMNQPLQIGRTCHHR